MVYNRTRLFTAPDSLPQYITVISCHSARHFPRNTHLPAHALYTAAAQTGARCEGTLCRADTPRFQYTPDYLLRSPAIPSVRRRVPFVMRWVCVCESCWGLLARDSITITRKFNTCVYVLVLLLFFCGLSRINIQMVSKKLLSNECLDSIFYVTGVCNILILTERNNISLRGRVFQVTFSEKILNTKHICVIFPQNNQNEGPKIKRSDTKTIHGRNVQKRNKYNTTLIVFLPLGINLIGNKI